MMIPVSPKPVVFHRGIYKKTVTVSEAVFLITGMTIGAGVLGIPYVVAQVGLIIGLVYIFGLGLVMLCLNLMIGEIAARAGENLQLPGLAGKYLGGWAKHFLTLIVILSSTGALLAYISGEGQALAAIFGGSPVWWSLFFWSVGSFLVWRGMETVKSVDGVLSLLVILIIAGLSIWLLPDVDIRNFYHFNLGQIFLPYGVILFALHASPAIAEAHAVLRGDVKDYRRAVIIGTVIPILVYLLFALATVGVNGLMTTEMVTVGLGQRLGSGVLLISNFFAILAMSTAFLGLGMALKQSFTWDYKLPKWVADVLVILLPLALFTAGWRSFFSILDLVGGLFISIEAIIMVLVCYQVLKKERPSDSSFGLRHFWLLAVPVMIVFTLMTVYSILKLF